MTGAAPGTKPGTMSTGYEFISRRKFLFVAIVTVLIFMATLSQLSSFRGYIHEEAIPRLAEILNVNVKGSDVTYPVDDVTVKRTGEWSPYMDIISEAEALSRKPLTDIKESVSVKNSRVELLDPKNSYKVGEDIRVRITMFDGRGRLLQRGGDQLRVRIYENKLGASASGYVLDHNNGSYTAVVKALWEGSPSILVYISYSREAVRALYQARKTLLATRIIQAIYTSGGVEEKTYCHPFASKLTSSTGLCDFSSRNGKMSWFCIKPRRLSCENFAYNQLQTPYPDLPITPPEKTLLKRNMEHLNPVLNVVINGSRVEKETLKLPCAKFDREKLWTLRSPVGYFYSNRWNIIHCKTPLQESINEFLKNKKIIFYGDSTIRQWFVNVMERFKCRLTTAPWSKQKWPEDSAAFCQSRNLTIEWIVHSHPGNVAKKRLKINSIADHMLRHSAENDVIFVIHMLCHVSAYHHGVFKDRMLHTRKSIEKVLEHNKNTKILVKGGHTFADFTQVSDYYGYVYRVVMLEVFDGLLDKIVYLDNKDMTVAMEIKPNHPPDSVVTQMVNQMFSYLVE